MPSPSPVPKFTQVELTGPADVVAVLMRNLSSVGEVIFGPVQRPARGSDVTCTAQVVTHPSSEPISNQQTVSVTVQTVLEVEPGALVDPTAALHVEASVTAAVQALPGVLKASSRYISAVGLPATRE